MSRSWSAVRAPAAGPTSAPELTTAPRRDGRHDRRQAAVAVESRRYEGEVLDLLVQPKRDNAAAVRLMRKLLKKYRYAPDVLVTDKLRSYAYARRELGLSARHEQGLRKNNRAENSHQTVRRRERKN